MSQLLKEASLVLLDSQNDIMGISKTTVDVMWEKSGAGHIVAGDYEIVLLRSGTVRCIGVMAEDRIIFRCQPNDLPVSARFGSNDKFTITISRDPLWPTI